MPPRFMEALRLRESDSVRVRLSKAIPMETSQLFTVFTSVSHLYKPECHSLGLT